MGRDGSCVNAYDLLCLSWIWGGAHICLEFARVVPSQECMATGQAKTASLDWHSMMQFQPLAAAGSSHGTKEWQGRSSSTTWTDQDMRASKHATNIISRMRLWRN